MNDQHANHEPSDDAFFALPRQRKITVKQANDLINTSEKVRGNTKLTQHAINSNLNRARGKVIAKDIHNERAKKRHEGEEYPEIIFVDATY